MFFQNELKSTVKLLFYPIVPSSYEAPSGGKQMGISEESNVIRFCSLIKAMSLS